MDSKLRGSADTGRRQGIDTFLDTAWGADTTRAPVWIMRQAGRYLPEYREIKSRASFWQMCSTPELAAELTLQPVRRFQVDAAILFSDIMTPLVEMCVPIEFTPSPVIAHPVRTAAAVDRLRVPDEQEIAPYVTTAIQLIRRACPVPLIGFAGAPLTLAAYLIQGSGSKDFAEFRAFLRQEPSVAHRLLSKLADVSIHYLRMQVQAGAEAVQLFDSWAGLHDERTFATFGRPYAARVLAALASAGVPRIYLAVDAWHLHRQNRSLPAEVIGVDWRVPLDQVRKVLPSRVLQGNLDPAVLCAPVDVITEEVTRTLQEGLGGPHIFNLGHGILPQTPLDHVLHLVDVVRSFDRTRRAHGDGS